MPAEHSSDAKPNVADGFAGERFPYAETLFKTGEDFEVWAEPGYARILRACVVSIQMLMSRHIIKTRNTNPGRQKNGGQKNEDQTRVDRDIAVRHCSASWDWPGLRPRF
jgi:hypothetical protein